MRKSIFMVMLALLLAVPAFAVNKDPMKELIVASDGEFTTITAALASLPTPNTTPVVIKVMPGTYNESIQMKDNVNLVGSGQESTKITSSSEVTVNGANNAAIENIWVENTYTDSSTNTIHVAAILNNDTSMRVNNVKITATLSSWDEYYGIRSIGANSKLVITNCYISIVNTVGTEGRGAIGISIEGGGAAIVSDCVIELNNIDGRWSAGIYSYYGGITTTIIRNTLVKATGAQYNWGVKGTSDVTISNSRIEVIGTSNTTSSNLPLYGGMTVVNSEIIASGDGIAPYIYSGNKIGGSLISGITNYGGSSTKLVNCWDGDFNPIPNQ